MGMPGWGAGGSVAGGGISAVSLDVGDHPALGLAAGVLGTICACLIIIVDRLTARGVLRAAAAVYDSGGDGAAVTQALLNHYPKSDPDIQPDR
jgi:hypothetical protein